MRCLVVDENVAFATLLSEELMRLGYEVSMCHSGEAALAMAGGSPPDLALLDMGLDAPDALTVAAALRRRDPEVRLILIPMVGEDPVLDATAPSIQGVLPKPFFLPELPDRIASALAAPVLPAARTPPVNVPVLPTREEAPPSAVLSAGVEPEGGVDADSGLASAPQWRLAFERHADEIASQLSELAYDVGASAALLTDGAGLLTAVGALAADQMASISEAVLQGRRASQEVGRALGREALRFEQSLAGGDYTLYALGLDGAGEAGALYGECDAILALAVAGEAQLGLLRLRARATGARISELLSA